MWNPACAFISRWADSICFVLLWVSILRMIHWHLVAVHTEISVRISFLANHPSMVHERIFLILYTKKGLIARFKKLQRLNHIWRWCQPKQKVYTSREPFSGFTDSQKDLKLRKILNSISNSLSSHQRFHLINEFTTIWTSCLFWEIAQLNFLHFFLFIS